MQKYWLLLLSCFFFALPFAQEIEEGSEGERIEKRFERYVSRMQEKPLDEIWRYCARIEDLGEEVIPFIKQSIEQQKEKTQLGLSKVLITLGDREYAMDVLMDLLEDSEDNELRLQASRLIGGDGFSQLQERLFPLIEEVEDPTLKIAVAQACWQVGRRDHSVLNVLTQMLSHSDIEVTNTAGLALAEIDQFELAEEVLKRLKTEPSVRGRFVRILLEQQEILKKIENYKAEVKNTHTNGERKGDPVEEVKAIVLKNMDGIEEDLDLKKLTEFAGKGMAEVLDQHTDLWTPEEYRKFTESIDQAYAGIGAYVGMRDGKITIISPIYTGPSYKAGIRSGDQVLQVQGESTDNKSVEDLIKILKGKEGEIITLKILREGWSEPKDIKVTRSNIEIASCKYEMLPGKIGYFLLTQFGEKTGRELKAVLLELEAQGMKGAILDLRDNGGGYMSTAKEIVEQFVEYGKVIVWSEGRNAEIAPRNTLYATNRTPYRDLPLVCLINGGSASSSEITAGALKDHKRAILIGTHSYGKGTVQQPLQMKSWPGASLKLTIAKYYLPNGQCVHKERDLDGNLIKGKEGGIEPDIVVPETTEESWLSEAYELVYRSKKLQRYVFENYPKHTELFKELSENDYLDPSRYPGFEELYQSLETKASKNQVRRWLRSLIQVRVADDRGKEFVTNFNEDRQLQRAILEILFLLKQNPQKIVEYRAFLDKYKELLEQRLK